MKEFPKDNKGYQQKFAVRLADGRTSFKTCALKYSLMPIRVNHKKLFIISLALLFIMGCNSKDKKLWDYYRNNSKLHQELSDSLMEFSKRYKTAKPINRGFSKVIYRKGIPVFFIKEIPCLTR